MTDIFSIIEQVRKVLKWDMEQYAMFQYEQGLAYLEKYLPADVDGQRILEREAMFWAWWKMCWYRRDEQFLVDCIEAESHLALNCYYYIHDADELIQDIKPPKHISRVTLLTQKSQ
ncbi:MAG: hypothetical protein KAF40_00970 [Flavihumibacter sp.]|nr:hypothetical protein [Flavihumibacter sp.]